MNLNRLSRFIESIIANKRIVNLITFILLIPLLFINVKDSHNWGGDFSQYIHQAINIVESIPQSETNYIFNDQNPYLGPPAYPVGFPILLAPVYLLFGNSILAFSAYLSLLLVILFIVTYRFFNLFFSNIISLLMVIVIAYNPWVLRFKASILSDIPFTLFFIASILFYYRNLKTDKVNIGYSIILGVLIGFSMLIKSIGIVVLIGILLENFVLLIITKKLKENRSNIINSFVVTVSTFTIYILITFVILPTKTEHYSFFSQLFNFQNLGNTLLKSSSYYISLIQGFFSKIN